MSPSKSESLIRVVSIAYEEYGWIIQSIASTITRETEEDVQALSWLI